MSRDSRISFCQREEEPDRVGPQPRSPSWFSRDEYSEKQSLSVLGEATEVASGAARQFKPQPGTAAYCHCRLPNTPCVGAIRWSLTMHAALIATVIVTNYVPGQLTSRYPTVGRCTNWPRIYYTTRERSARARVTRTHTHRSYSGIHVRVPKSVTYTREWTR